MWLFGSPDVEKLTSKRDLKGLIKALGYKRDADVRRAAAQALPKIGDSRAVGALTATLEDRDRDARDADG